MERDFLGMNGKDSGNMAKEEGRGSRPDSAYLGGGPAVQWPFSNKISALQQFMSYRAGQEERSKRIVFDHVSSSGFQPIATVESSQANYKSSPSQAQQKCFSFERQGIHQFPLHAHQSQGISVSSDAPTIPTSESKSLPGMVHHHVPVATSNPFFKVHGSAHAPNVTTLKQQPLGGGIVSGAPSVGSIAAGPFAPRNGSKPSAPAAQLTIFYAGSVNVFDDVPLDKAQAIMFLASKGANVLTNAANPRPEAPVSTLAMVAGVDGLDMNPTQIQTPAQTQTQTQNHVASPCSGVSTTISAASHTGAHSGSGGSTSGGDMAVAKSVGPLAPNSQNEPSSKNTTAPLGSAAPTSAVSRAIPQARKASLARFLEKRKERVTSAAPYPSTKNPSANDVGIDGPSSKSSTTDITLSSSREELWDFSCQPKKSADCGVYPSTRLEM